MNKKQTSVRIDRLSKFSKPNKFLALVRESESIPDDRFFNDPHFQPLREAWAAGHFALGLQRFYDSIEVRLDPDRFPDFHLRINKQVYGFEFTVADEPERMIGKEYKERKNNPLLSTPYQPERGCQEGPSWVAAAVKKKYKKHYSDHPNLLVYANFEASSLDPSEIIKLCYQWSNSFNSIWILWCYNFIPIFKPNIFNKVAAKWHSVGVNPWA